MRTVVQRHLTYANVVATLALFVALGGSAFAAGYVITKSSQIKDGVVTGSDVKNGSLTGSDVKDASLTGADINPAQLGKVPSAAIADRAASAMNATTAERAQVSDEVDGQHVERIAAAIPPGTSTQVVGVDGGLQILAGCSASGELALAVSSTTAHALFRASVISLSTPPAEVQVVDDADLNPGDNLPLFQQHGNGTAQVAYQSTDGRVLTAVIGFGELTGPQTCTVNGTLIRAG
jgi:hypothetical protein